MEYIQELLSVFITTLGDVFPIVAVIFGFQFLVIRKKPANFKNILIGFVFVIFGLTFFLVGLENGLFPLGELMAKQLTDPKFIYGDLVLVGENFHWLDYKWVYLFAAAIGFSTTIAEPSLMAVAIKAQDVSGGAIHAWGLRMAVAFGVAFGVALGSYRIVMGYPLYYFIITGYAVVILQTLVAPKMIIGLAYDSGGVTTSTVTVPLVAALGLGLATTIEGRSAVLDGFGLIAFASLFPIITVLAYAQISFLWDRK